MNPAGHGTWTTTLALLFLPLVACTGENQNFAHVAGDELLMMATVQFADREGDPPLTDVVDAAQLGSDTLLVVDAAGPFVHLYTTEGVFLERLAPKGDGPGELQRPWDIVVNESRIWFLDRAGAVAWDRSSFQEIERIRIPPLTAALTRGCGEDLIAIVQGSTTEDNDGSKLRQYAISKWTGRAWEEITTPPPADMPFLASWPRFSATAWGDRVAMLHWWERRIEVLPCGPSSTDVLPVMDEAEMELDPAPEGIEVIGGDLLVFFGDRRMPVDTTHVALIDAAGQIRRLSVTGRFGLHDASNDVVWLSSLSLEPRVVGIRPDELIRWIDDNSRTWKAAE